MALYNDPLDSADNPEIGVPRYYGQAIVDAWYSYFKKGEPVRPFIDGQDPLDCRYTSIKLGILPLAEQNITRDIFRQYFAEWGAWPKITLPSLKALGLTVKMLANAWVCIELVKDGTTYTSKTTGETKDSLTFKIVAHYPDEAACRAAYLTQSVTSGQEPATPSQPTPTNGTNGHNGNGNGNGADKEKATALQFVKSLITATKGDEAALAQRIAGIPQIAKHFTAQSTEVRNLLDAYQFEQMSRQAA